MKRMTRLFPWGALALVLVGCGGTYVDDKRNFERAFRSPQPRDVKVIHSLYWQSPHFTDEHCYFFELQPLNGSDILKTLTAARDVVPATAGVTQVPKLVLDPPPWFAPKALEAYDAWISTNQFWTFGVLRDQQEGRIFVYGQSL